MSTIKKIGVLVSMVFLSLNSAAAETDEARTIPGRYSFSLSPLFGILYGRGEEIVYKYPKQNQYLSELLWDIKPLYYAGIAGDFGPRDPFRSNGFIAALSLKFSIPMKTGVMEDRDWMNKDDLGNPHYDFLTNYSRHDAYSHLPVILMDLSAGYSWRLTDNFALAAYGEFSNMLFSWSAKDGYIQYPKDSSGDYLFDQPWSADLEKDSFKGTGIRYVQNWFTLSPGFSLRWKINSLFSLEGKFNYSPLIFVLARDDHLARDMTFWDYLFFGQYFGFGAGFIYSPLKNLDISLSLSYREINGTRGMTYQQEGDGPTGKSSNNLGGAGYSAFDIGLTARLRVAGKN